jgi:hypothetical protein
MSVPWKRAPARAWLRTAFWVAMGVWVATAIALSLTRVPWFDEGELADPAWRFATLNRLGSICLTDQGLLRLPQVHEYTFWHFPGYFIVIGLVFKLTGLSLIAMRGISVILGLALIFGCRQLLLQLSDDTNFANLAGVLLAFDFSILTSASAGRMDILCAVAGMWSLAMLVTYARTGSAWMMVASGAAFGLSAVTHPLAVLYGACWVIVAAFLFAAGWDWRKAFSYSRILLFFLPVAILFGFWIAYITPHWDAFLAQTAALAYRVPNQSNPFSMVLNDILHRYFGYSLWPGIRGFRNLVTLMPWLAFIAVPFTPGLRSAALSRVLWVITIATVLLLAVLDHQMEPPYLLHTMAPLTIMLALVMGYFAPPGGAGRIASAITASLMICFSLGGNVLRVREMVWQRDYLPVIAIAKQALSSGQPFMGGSELGFGIGFTPRLIDDPFVGLFSGLTTDYFFDNPISAPGDETLAGRARNERVRAGYRLILQNPSFRVYRRK